MIQLTREHDTQSNVYEYTHMQRGSCHRTILAADEERKEQKKGEKEEEEKLNHLEKG